jgi:predicted ATPase
MRDVRLLRSLSITNLLSYGPATVTVDLEPLNVIIGPNGSGKSNLLTVLALLRSTVGNFEQTVKALGGAADLVWKGDDLSEYITLSALVCNNRLLIDLLQHDLVAWSASGFLLIGEERVAIIHNDGTNEVICDRKYADATVTRKLYQADGDSYSRENSESVALRDLDTGESILALLKDPSGYRSFWELTASYETISFYRGIDVGPKAAVRLPQPSGAPDDWLEEDGSNLAAVINRLLLEPGMRPTLLDHLRHFYSGVDDIGIRLQGTAVQLYLHERGLKRPVPANRWSDGLLRFVCLLAVLCHPNPRGLVCLEEPEAGLHPDMLVRLADLLVEASERMQIIVTTHSDALVSRLSSRPESILVAERGAEGTTLRRLEPERLQKWLTDYTLADLWAMGELGGNP